MRVLRDVLLRIGTETDVNKLTPHAWKQLFADEVRAHKQQVLDLLLPPPLGPRTAPDA